MTGTLEALVSKIRALGLIHAWRHASGGPDEVNATGTTTDTVLKALFDANTILKADTDNTPEALTLAASRIVARLAAGGIIAATVQQVLNLLLTTQDDIIVRGAADPERLNIAASRIVGKGSAGNLAALTGAQVMAVLSGQAAADFAMNTHKITGVVDPAAAQDAATKKYVDDNLPAGPYTQGCRIYNNAHFAVADATAWVTHPFNAEDYDTDTMHDLVTNNERITFTTAGKYLVVLQFKWDANVTGRRIIGIRDNNGTFITFSEQAIPGNFTFNMNVVTLENFSAADWVEAICYQNSGGALLARYDAGANCYFMAQRVG